MWVRIPRAAFSAALMHSPATVTEALRLRDEEGLGARAVARRLGLPLELCATGMRGVAGALKTAAAHPAARLPRRCGQDKHAFESVPPEYV